MTPAKSNRRFRLTVFSAIVIILALGSAWLNLVIKKGMNDTISEKIRTEPDYYVDNFRFFRILPNGKPHYEVSGIKLTHQPVDDSYLVDKPIVKNTDNRAQLQTMRSNYALIQEDNTKIHMHGNVILNRFSAIPQQAFKLTSEYLLLLPDEDIMRTDLSVVVHRGTTIMTAVGMQANNATGELKLFNQAKVIYLPPNLTH